MAFFTGKGDGGTTKLFDSPSGLRVTKTSPIFECLGMLDELNAITGWCKVGSRGKSYDVRGKSEIQNSGYEFNGKSFESILLEVQNHLFTIQAEVAGAHKNIPTDSTEKMSALISAIEKSLPEVKTFLIAGGSEFSSRLDIARAVSRRVERRLVGLNESGERAVSEISRAYANRLSSLFYALERLANHIDDVKEVPPQYTS